MGERATLKFGFMAVKSFFISVTLLMSISCVALADSKDIDNVSSSSSVFQAVIDSDVSAISRYLLVGGDKEIAGSMGMTPLALAVQRDKREVINLLVSKGANLSAKNNDGWSLLHLASSLPVAKTLLKKGVSLKSVDKDGNTPLHTTSSKKVATFYIAKGLSINARNNKGQTALHIASKLGHAELVTFLLASHADVNARDQYGKTPLFLAKKLEIIQLLLKNNADLDVRDSLGQTILHHSIDKKVLTDLIERGASVTARDFEGTTPLHRVSSRSSSGKTFAEQLLFAGANIEARDSKGRTPLHTVNSLEVATLLLDLGAHLYVKDNQGKTPLQLATERSNKKIIDLFTKNLTTDDVDISKTQIKPIQRVRSSGSLQRRADDTITQKIANTSDVALATTGSSEDEDQEVVGPPKPELTATLMIEPKFEAAGAFHKGSAPVRVEGKWGLIDTKGEWILAPTFTEIGTNKEGLLPVKAGDKFGYIDAKGTAVTEFKYEAVKPFSEGLAAVKEDGQWGFILPDGTKYLETAGFDDAGSFKDGVAPVKLAEGWGYALREWSKDESGKKWLFFPLFQEAYDFSEGHGVVKVNHLMGLVDSEKKKVIKPSFANMKKYTEGMLPVSKKSGEWFFVDNKGNTVIDDTFQNVSSFSEGLVSVKKKGKWGYINKQNEVVIPLKYDRAYDFHDGVAVVVSNKNRFFIDKQGRPLSEHYADVFRVSEGYAAVKVGDQWGYVFIPTSSMNEDSKKSDKQTTKKVKDLTDH